MATLDDGLERCIEDSTCMLCDRDLNLPQSDAEPSSKPCYYCGRVQARQCPKRDRGCEWTGEYKLVIRHNIECIFADVECTKCNWRGERRELLVHEQKKCPRRPYRCNHCGDTVPYEEVRTRHWPNCKMYPEPAKERDQVLDAALGRISELEKANNKKDQQIDELQERLRQRDHDMQKRVQEFDAALGRLSKLEEALNKKDQQIDELQKRLRQQDHDMQKRAKEFDAALGRLTKFKLEEALNIKDQQIDELQKRLRQQDRDMRKRDQEFDAALGRLSKLEEKLANVEELLKQQVDRQMKDDMPQKFASMKEQLYKDLLQKLQKEKRELEDYLRSEIWKVQQRSVPSISRLYLPSTSPPYRDYTPLLPNRWEIHAADDHEVLTNHAS